MDIYKDYTNHTSTIQTFMNVNGNPVTVEVGETVPILVERNVKVKVEIEAEVATAPNPPADLQSDKRKFVNIYKAPKA